MKAIYLTLFLYLPLSLFAQSDQVYTQSYLDKSTRFAWFTYGGDINFLTGGQTQQLSEGILQNTDFGHTLMPRLTIGGIHFWGHADFYVTFPLSFLTLQDVPQGLNSLEVYQGVETGARLYPLRLKPKRLSPFLGLSFRRIRFAQEPEDNRFDNGVPNYGRFIYPLQFGLTYTSDRWHISASGYYNFQNTFDYYITPQATADVELNPLSFNLSLLRYIDSDRHMRTEKAVESINENYRTLREEGLLSAWFWGIGPSAALQRSRSPYLAANFPFFYDDYAASVLPDLSLGRYFHKPDLSASLTYRTYGNTYEGFDNKIQTRRHSVGVESVKFLFNYLGFVPFVGPALTYEHLRATVNQTVYTEQKIAAGITFGWDIRVTRTGSSLLRTNLRYYPNLHMTIEGERLMFDHLEFNFIQWVQFIGRKKALRR